MLPMIIRISTVLEALSTTILLHSLYGKKYSLDIKTILFLAIDFTIFQGINEGYFPKSISIIIYFIIARYCMLEFKSSVKEMIINYILYIVLLGSMQVMGLFIVYILIPNTESKVQILGMNICALLVTVILSRALKLHRLSYFFQKKDVIVKAILVICVVGIIGIICYTKYQRGIYYDEFILVCILIIILCILTASWESYKIKVHEKEAELKMYQLYENSYESLLTEIRMRQHEFNNHISAIFSQHLTCDTYEELVKKQREYCGQVMSENRYEKLLVSGNTIFTGFLYGKFVEAENRGIDVSYRIDSTNLNISMPDYKVIELVGNLFNNAMEALEKVERKKMHLEIKTGPDETEIEVRNIGEKIQEEQISKLFLKGYSEKGKNRGLGLYNIKKLSKEYGFKIICENQEIENENWITFRVLF